MPLPPRRLLRDLGSVSPIVGSVLILAISVLGVAGVLYWGAPTIDRIQSRNAQSAMEGEFEGLRDASQELSVPDHSRFPTISIAAGELRVQQGSRFMLTADHDATKPTCDFHVTGWPAAGTSSVTVGSTNCRAPTTTCTTPMAATAACMEIYSVGGTTTVKQTVTLSGATASVSGADFSKGDWMFRLTDGNPTPTIYAEAWLHSSDQIAWSLKSSTGTRELYLDGGAIFSRSDGAWFLEKEAPLGDTSFGTGYYGFWLRALVAGTYSSINGIGSHQVFLSLLGNAVRIDATGVNKLRFDVSGSLAEPWCNAFLARNARLTNAAYAVDGSFPCANGGANGLRSVTYTCSDATKCPGNAFQLRFLHARIDTSLAI